MIVRTSFTEVSKYKYILKYYATYSALTGETYNGDLHCLDWVKIALMMD